MQSSKKRIFALVVLLGLEALLFYAWRPDRAFWEGKPEVQRGPRAGGSQSGEQMNWALAKPISCLQILAAYDWYFAIHLPRPAETLLANGKPAIDSTRVFGMKLPWDKVGSLYVVQAVDGAAIIADLLEPMSSADFAAAWKESGTQLHGINLLKSAKGKGMFAQHAFMPNDKIFVSGTNRSVLTRIILAAVGEIYPIREPLLAKDQTAFAMDNLLSLRSKFQSQAMGSSLFSKGDGLLSKIVLEDWCRDVAGGTIVVDATGKIANLSFRARDAATAAVIKTELEKLIAAAGAKLEGGKLHVDQLAIEGKAAIAEPLPMALLRLLETPQIP